MEIYFWGLAKQGVDVEESVGQTKIVYVCIDKCKPCRLQLMVFRLIVSFQFFYVMCTRLVEVSTQQVEPVAAAATPPPAATETVSAPPKSFIVVVQGSIVQFKVFTTFYVIILLTVILQKQCM